MSSDNYNEYIDKGIHLFRKGVKGAKKLGKKANKEIKKAAGLPTGQCTETNPRYYIVVARQGAMVRKGIEMDSPQVHGLRRADICTVVNISGRRARIVEPVDGWVSLYTADGEVIMRQTLPPDRREQNIHLDRRFEQVKREQDRVGGYKEAVKIANDHATAAMGEGGDAGGSALAAERYQQRENSIGGTAADFGYANRRDSGQDESAVATAASLSTVSVRNKESGVPTSRSSSTTIPKLAAPGTLPKLAPPPSRRQQQNVEQSKSVVQQQQNMDLLGFDDEEEEEEATSSSQQEDNGWNVDSHVENSQQQQQQPSSAPQLDIFSLYSTSTPQQQPPTTLQHPTNSNHTQQMKKTDPTNPFAALQGISFPSTNKQQQQQQQSMTQQQQQTRGSSLPPSQSNTTSNKPPSSSSSAAPPTYNDPFADLI